ncbi:YjfB family protein [Desulfosporosinus sp. Sb-LF]|uniref:YjfB family protein n=1 Tax=Desulfosporosinus sp. Sb-LF TaxID=2560027 RepID=UPI00107F4F6A|nr:YjfB family protein [Desulfosporosinus sp. Sb-LF]TGE32601.1 putative motility protein [Desulfosporosinus sp. Sb-LF]
MDIAAMSVVLSQGKVQQQAGISVMKMAMGVEATKGDSIASLVSGTTKTMETSVQPNLGANLDIQA